MTAFLFCCTGYPEAAWLAALRQHLPPEVEVRTMQAMGDPADIAYVAAWMPPDGLLASLPNLKVIFSIASGVGHILKDPSVPAHVPLVRMSDPMQWNLMAEFAVLGVLTFHRFLPFYLDNQKDGRWEVRWPLDTPTRPVGVLGLGGSGRAVAARLTDLGFTVHGWSRRKHEIAGITTWAGPDGLRAMLPRCAYVVCVLPLTDETRGLMDRAFFAALPDGAHLINIGRGEHIVQADLLAALDSGRLAGAFLDVFDQEPLPPDHPYWRHPKIIVTPHVAGELLPRSAMKVMADNVRRHMAGAPLPNLYDRALQY